MDKKSQLKEINTELKIYVNEASFVSNSCRNKLIRYLGDAFDIKLPIENFAKIDVSLLEDGSIEMRDEVYQREDSLSFDEVLERYHTFKEKADNLLKRKSKDSFPLNEIMKHPNVVEMISNNDLANLLVTQGDCLDDKTFTKLANRILTDKDMMSKVILAGSPRVDFEKIKSMVLKSVDTAAMSKFGMLYEERCDLSPIYRRICDLTYGIKLNSKLKQQRLKDLEKLQPFYEVNRKRIKLNKRAEILELYSR